MSQSNAPSQPPPSSSPPAAPAHLAAQPAGPFATQQRGAQSRIDAGPYSVERVVFTSGGVDVVGNRFVPAGAGAKSALALILDPRYHGESVGEPRRWESRRAKADAARIGLVGICQGVNWAVEAAAEEPRVRAVSLSDRQGGKARVGGRERGVGGWGLHGGCRRVLRPC